VSGVISLLIAIFGIDVAPRGLNAVFALVRIVAGLALLYCIPSGLRILTLVFAVFLIVEGLLGIFGSLKIRQQKGCILLLLNGVVTLVLGLMVYAHWPTGSVWILGFFFGVSILCQGFAPLMLGLLAPKTGTECGFEADILRNLRLGIILGNFGCTTAPDRAVSTAAPPPLPS